MLVEYRKNYKIRKNKTNKDLLMFASKKNSKTVFKKHLKWIILTFLRKYLNFFCACGIFFPVIIRNWFLIWKNCFFRVSIRYYRVSQVIGSFKMAQKNLKNWFVGETIRNFWEEIFFCGVGLVDVPDESFSHYSTPVL